MKKLILAAITLASAASVFAQGTVNFNMRLGGTAHVYAPLDINDRTGIQGNASNDGPAGTTNYGARVLIGGNGVGAAPDPSHYLGQLLGASGAGAPESSLLPSTTPPVSFRTGTAAGSVVNGGATFGNILPDAAAGSFEMVAWDNTSGLYPTWAQASVAWAGGLIAAGRSAEFTIANIGGNNNTPPGLIPGLTSFNLFYAVPEPTTAALAGLGAAALLIFRRRK
jgi:hypothetical protein